MDTSSTDEMLLGIRKVTHVVSKSNIKDYYFQNKKGYFYNREMCLSSLIVGAINAHQISVAFTLQILR